MLALLSPSKTQDFGPGWKTPMTTLPAFLEHAETLIKTLRPLSARKLEELMGISPKLATLNHERFEHFRTPFTAENAKPAILAFQGDVYDGLDAASLTQPQLDAAQQKVRMLSGLYGLLRPLDLIQPYRLEMGIKLKNPRGKDLYAFWGDLLTQQLNTEITTHHQKFIVNLASMEYFSAIQPAKLRAPVITAHFRDWKARQYKTIGLFAKKARGRMARFITAEKIENVSDLTQFHEDGYRFSPDFSSENDYVFIRKK